MSKRITINDSLNNYVAGFGINGDNVLAKGNYLNTSSRYITKNRLVLSNMYRSSWIVGKVVDVIAEDMTKNGIEIIAGKEDVNVTELQRKILNLGVWESISNGIKWGKLYGGALGIILIEGEDITTPLNLDRIEPNSFKGIAVYDRWQVVPSYEVTTEYGENFCLPKSYDIYPINYYEAGAKNNIAIFKDVHWSRCIRFIGIELPHFEKVAELYWGESIVERLYDRILIFDSATYGASNLLLKSYLRVLKLDGLRQAIATGGMILDNIHQYISSIAKAQASTGMYVTDSKDELDTSSFSFSGMDKALAQFGEQLAGATGIPIVRLFGQPPSGFNSSGEIDLRSYFDTIKTNQQKYLLPVFNKLIPIIYKSEFGKDLGDDWSFDFVPLWQPTDMDKAEISKSDAQIARDLYECGIFTRDMALDFLKDKSKISGRFGTINKNDYGNIPPLTVSTQQNDNKEDDIKEDNNDTSKPEYDKE